MSERKIHVRYVRSTSCGLNIDTIFPVKIAKKYADVTCKTCKKSFIYKGYLNRQYREKPPK